MPKKSSPNIHRSFSQGGCELYKVKQNEQRAGATEAPRIQLGCKVLAVVPAVVPESGELDRGELAPRRWMHTRSLMKIFEKV